MASHAPAFDYHALTRIQKIAAFLIALGEEAAAELFRHFDDEQTALIAKEMVNLPMIDVATQKQIFAEFTTIVASATSTALGGTNYMENVLLRAKGSDAGMGLLNRLAPPARANITDSLQQMEPRQIVSKIKCEQPQTICFIVSCLDPAKAAEVLTLFPEEQREEVLERLGKMEQIPSYLLEKVVRRFGAGATETQRLHATGGVQSVAAILNAFDKTARRSMIGRIDARNPEMGNAVRKILFSFDDLIRISTSDLQRILREVDTNDLILALKPAKPALVNAILGAMSKRAAEGIRDEMTMMANVKPREIEAAQDRIITAVRRLEEAEEISLDGQEENGD